MDATPTESDLVALADDGAPADSGAERGAGTDSVPSDDTPSAGVAVEAVEAERGSRVGVMRRLVDTIVWMNAYQWGLVALVAAYTAYFTAITLDVHHGTGTSAYDFGLYDQGIWLMSRFKAPFVTLMGRNLMGDHTSFILVLLVPLYWIWPSAGVLFFTQALFIGLGAVPVFLLARKLLRHDAYALAMAAAYLLHPAVGWTNRENFHPDAYIAVFVGFAIYAAIERKWRMYALFVVLALLVKEDASLVLVPLGIWVAVKRDRKIGLISVVGCLSFMLAAMFLVMRSLIGVPTRNGWRIPFGGPMGVIKTAFTNPLAVLRHYWSDSRPFYFWQMTFPVAFVFLAGPSVAMVSLLVMSTNMLSTFWYQYQIQYHYALVAVPGIVMGTVWAISKVRVSWRPALVVAVTLNSLWAGWAWGALPFSRNVPYSWPRNHPVAEAMRDIIDDIPADAVVSAQYAVTAHIDHREEIYMFPTPFSASLYGPDDSLGGKELPAAARVRFVMLPITMDVDQEDIWARFSSDFTLVEQNEWWRLYERTSMIDAAG